MWYIIWALGLAAAVALGVFSVMRYEAQESRKALDDSA